MIGRRATARIAGVGLSLALALASRPALACAVCMAGNDEGNRTAFLVTTIFLSALPLLGVGSLVWWLRRRARALEPPRPPQPASPLR